MRDSDVSGGGSKRPVSTVTVGGDTSEVVEDDDISIISDDGEVNPNGNVCLRSSVHAQSYCRKLSIWKNVIQGEGQIFQSVDGFRQMIFQFAIVNHFNYRFERNCKQRIVVKCQATECPFYMCVRGGKNTNVMYLKDYNGHHKHSVGEMCQMGV